MAKKFFTVVTDLGFNFSCVNEKTEDRHLVLASSKLLNKFWFTARKKLDQILLITFEPSAPFE